MEAFIGVWPPTRRVLHEVKMPLWTLLVSNLRHYFSFLGGNFSSMCLKIQKKCNLREPLERRLKSKGFVIFFEQREAEGLEKLISKNFDSNKIVNITFLLHYFSIFSTLLGDPCIFFSGDENYVVR